MEKIKILILSPDTGRTGAPVMLLRLLKYLSKTHNNICFDLIVEREGVLQNEFEVFISRFLGKLYWKGNSRLDRWKNRVAGLFDGAKKSPVKLYLGEELAYSYFKNNNYQAILANTLTVGSLLEEVTKLLHCPVITYVHELELFISLHMSEGEIFKALRNSNYFAVPCKEAAENLITNHGITSDKIVTIPSAFEPNIVSFPQSRPRLKGKNWLVGTVGTPTWIKGADFFFQTCQIFFQLFPQSQVDFVWLGGDPEHIEYRKLSGDIKKAGLAMKIRLISSVPNPMDYLAEFDLMFMSSREECLPLVMLEAASLKVPVVGFDKTGGGATFISESGGKPVMFGNCVDMAKLINRYLHDESERKRLGLSMYHKLTQEHLPADFTDTWGRLIHKALQNSNI